MSGISVNPAQADELPSRKPSHASAGPIPTETETETGVAEIGVRVGDEKSETTPRSFIPMTVRPDDNDVGRPLRIVMLASEAVPFAKTGGLADVAGALPLALSRLGHHATLIIPCYRKAWDAGPLRSTGVTLKIRVGPRWLEADLYHTVLPDSTVDAYLIDLPEFYDRPQLYGENGADYTDNCARFSFYCRAALDAVVQLQLKPDILHCNDWQTGLIPVYLEEVLRKQDPETWNNVGALMTIHNMAYQGSFWHWDMQLTGLPWELFHWRSLEFHGRLNFLKAGLVYGDAISTVSPTYAREIQSQEFGCGLEGLLRERHADLYGIVNGIDGAHWNPAVDPHIAQNYDITTVTEGKAACKAHLQQLASLPLRPDVPLLAAISRLDPQKGWDLLTEVFAKLLRQDVQIVILGEGHQHYHDALDRMAKDHPDRMHAFLGFSNPLAHQIEAGADLFLMPSMYEPCGLNQMYSQIYGTVPVVRATGGLADTVIHASPLTLARGTATGFAFLTPNAESLYGAVQIALELFPRREIWRKLIHAGMRTDFSWLHSARAYVRLYNAILQRRAQTARTPAAVGSTS